MIKLIHSFLKKKTSYITFDLFSLSLLWFAVSALLLSQQNNTLPPCDFYLLHAVLISTVCGMLSRQQFIFHCSVLHTWTPRNISFGWTHEKWRAVHDTKQILWFWACQRNIYYVFIICVSLQHSVQINLPILLFWQCMMLMSFLTIVQSALFTLLPHSSLNSSQQKMLIGLLHCLS